MEGQAVFAVWGSSWVMKVSIYDEQWIWRNQAFLQNQSFHSFWIEQTSWALGNTYRSSSPGLLSTANNISNLSFMSWKSSCPGWTFPPRPGSRYRPPVQCTINECGPPTCRSHRIITIRAAQRKIAYTLSTVLIGYSKNSWLVGNTTALILLLQTVLRFQSLVQD